MIWIILIITVLALFSIDLGLTRHKAGGLSVADALLQTGFWVTIGLGFGFLIYFTFEHNLLQKYIHSGDLSGQQALVQYLSVYFFERTLSFDNLFLMVLIFAHLKIQPHLQYRVLFYGLMITICLRVGFIYAGVSLLDSFDWMNYVLAALLLFGTVRMIANFSSKHSHKLPGTLELLNKFLPVSDDPSSTRFFVRANGRLFVTPLFICLISIEATDIIYASDSIPASLSVSSNLFILISASLFSILGIRALYFTFAHALQKLRYIKLALLIILFGLAIKNLLHNFYPIEPIVTLSAASLVVLISAVFSILHQDRGEITTLPILDSFSRVYHLTYSGFRRIIITVIGVSVLVVGIIMIVTPGPAIIVIPAGLAILATEFVWARLLLKKVKVKFVQYSKDTRSFFNKDNKDNE